ncbi:MAG: isocitrate/isopropylmalate family dehydrogenase, partial [Myxococcota bacterium]
PGIPGVPFRDVDITIVRENIEDTYGAIEHMQTHDVAQCRRLITRPGCEQVHRYAFEIARRKGARRLTCGHKANIMKLTDGMFLETFREVAEDYPDIDSDDRIVDALALDLVTQPHVFDVVVLPNLAGDILSDLCAGLVGGLAYAPSANVGDYVAIFEAVHGTAPELVGQDRANPSALLLSACIMLRHLGYVRHAERIQCALHEALAELHEVSEIPGVVSTRELTDQVTQKLDALPQPVEHPVPLEVPKRVAAKMMVTPRTGREDTTGIDLFIDSDLPPEVVAQTVNSLCPVPLSVTMVSNRGTQVWPIGSAYTDQVNHHRVRVESEHAISANLLFDLAARVNRELRVCSLEILMTIDEKPGFSRAQGQ